MDFDSLGLRPSLLQSIAQMGYSTPSPVQQQAIPLVLAGHDLVAQAQTGTGKTAAFGLPALQNLREGKGVDLLVVTPTRELAGQVAEELRLFSKVDRTQITTVYGGQPYGRQIGAINGGAQVVIATPGRLLDLIKSKKLQNFTPSKVVLDEADEMLDMGFLEDIKKIFSYLPQQRQTLLFSATMPEPIKKLAAQILKDPKTVSVNQEGGDKVAKNISEHYCVISEKERDDALIRLTDSQQPEKAVVFCRTKSEVDRLGKLLTARGYAAATLHGDIQQRQRESVIRAFKAGDARILVATDVAARGLDVKGVSHVFNFHIPEDPASYIHRIGRTARAGESGTAITLVNTREWAPLKQIIDKTGSAISYLQLPSLDQLQSSQYQNLADAIADTEPSKAADELLATLAQQTDAQTALRKLAAYTLSTTTLRGPEHIGFFPDELDTFFTRLKKGGPKGGGKPKGRGGFKGRGPKRFSKRR